MLRTLIIIFLFLHLAFSETLRIASASSFRFALNEIAERFEKKYKHRVLISYGASGHFYIQIRHGAPYDIFISANETYPEKLIEHGKAVKKSYTVFSRGKLALFTLKNIKLKSYKDVTKADRIAIANPKYAPYGKAALEFLKKTKLYEKVKGKLVYASNVSQAFQYVVSGGADVGLVALSLIIPYGKGNYLLVNERLYSPINNVAVITINGKEKKASWEFIEFLKSEEAREILRSFGFGVPQ